MAEQILQTAKMEKGDISLNLENTDLHELLAEVILQELDPLGDCRLGNVQQLRRPGKGPRFDGSNQGVQIPRFHSDIHI